MKYNNAIPCEYNGRQLRSKQALAVVEAFARGYRVNQAGQVLTPDKDILAGYKPSRGKRKDYIYFSFSKEFAHVMVHQLCAFQQYGYAALDPGIVARHRNDDTLDNRPENIFIGTNSDNMMDRPAHKRLEQARIAAKARRVLTDDEVREMRRLREEGWQYKALVEKFGCTKSTVSYVINRKMYQEIV